MTVFHALGSQAQKLSQETCHSYADCFYSAVIQLIAPICDGRSHFLLFQVSSGADKSITRGAGSPVVLPKHSAACSESHLLPPTRLSKPAGFKGSTNISAQHDHSVVPLEKMSAFMPIFTLQQTCRSEQNSHMAKNFWQHGLAETHLIILIQLWGQFYDSHKFYCSMTFNDIWALKFHLQENCHGKESEWKGMSDYSEPQVCMHSAKKISSC